MPPTVLEDALRLFPETGFVNAYGLTETSSSIAVLGPDDHRAALASADPRERARIGSVGRVLPGVEVSIRNEVGDLVPANEPGEIYVRGAQVAGEYLEQGSKLVGEGWFPTRDRGWLDDGEFLFVEGRADDTIIRGGENIAPAEIEDVLVRHDAVLEVCIAGVPDEEWGNAIAAFVVVKDGMTCTVGEIKGFAREHLRSSKTPDHVYFLSELPATQTGKILRKDLIASVA